MMIKRRNNFDIRHKEALTLFLKEYFELFFSDLAKVISFENAEFLDKELTALFDKEKNREDKEQHRITDALILVQIILGGKQERIIFFYRFYIILYKNI